MPDCFKMAVEDRLPGDFDRWDLQNEEGVPVALVAASLRRMPEGFGRREIADGEGRTAARSAALAGGLPGGFGGLDPSGADGDRLARLAAIPRSPEDFRDPGADEGWTVAEFKAAVKRIPRGVPDELFGDPAGSLPGRRKGAPERGGAKAAKPKAAMPKPGGPKAGERRWALPPRPREAPGGRPARGRPAGRIGGPNRAPPGPPGRGASSQSKKTVNPPAF